MGRPRKAPRRKDITGEYLAGHLDDDRLDIQQRFTQRAKHQQQNKIMKTAAMRAETPGDLESLPIGQVVQVFSVYCEVELNGKRTVCVVRKTLNKVSDTALVVGDRVRFRHSESITDAAVSPEAVIEQVLPRTTVLTRADSFKGIQQHPIVANAQQMLIVASVHKPRVKWGLIDRMLIAAKAGGLVPILCLNKVDLHEGEDDKEMHFAKEAMNHYASMGVLTLQTSVSHSIGLSELKLLLTDRTTVLAGHSGVGKSSLIRAIQPQLDLRVGDVSVYTEKGRHTTTSARRYELDFGGQVVDTPGVKLFGLWNVTQENLSEFFPDVEAETAPEWRMESFERINASLTS